MAKAVARVDGMKSAIFKDKSSGGARSQRPKARDSSRLWQEISKKAK